VASRDVQLEVVLLVENGKRIGIGVVLWEAGCQVGRGQKVKYLTSEFVSKLNLMQELR
jgi:hypothetical protein